MLESDSSPTSSLSREAAPHGSNSCNPPIPTMATNTLSSSCFLSGSLSQFPSRMRRLSLPLCSRLEALTAAGGKGEGEGSCLKASTEAMGENGTPTALGRGWAVGGSFTQGAGAGDGERNRRMSQGYRSWQLCTQKLPSRWLHYASSLLLIVLPHPTAHLSLPLQHRSCLSPATLSQPSSIPPVRLLQVGNAVVPSAASSFRPSTTSLWNLFNSIAVKNVHLNC